MPTLSCAGYLGTGFNDTVLVIKTPLQRSPPIKRLSSPLSVQSNPNKLSFFSLQDNIAGVPGVSREIKTKKANFERKKNFKIYFFSLAMLPRCTQRFPNKISANLVQPFGQLQLTYKYTNIFI